jgi:hypothetical protein
MLVLCILLATLKLKDNAFTSFLYMHSFISYATENLHIEWVFTIVEISFVYRSLALVLQSNLVFLIKC